MKRIKLLGLLIIALISFNSCETADDVVFIAQPDPEGISFTNSFLSEYVLTQATSGNLAERFVWNEVDLGVPTNITYELQASILADFSTSEVLGSTSETELAVTIGQFMSLATEAGLDNDPNTDDPNTGNLYFRVRSFAGTGGAENISPIQTLTVVLPEDTGSGSGVSISSWGVVGSGANDWGNAGPDLPFYTTNESNVFVAYVNLIDGEIKFRENNDWTNNFGDSGADGTLDAGGDNIAVTAGDYKITLDFNANTYSIEPYSWGIVGSAYNDWGNAGPDAKLFYDYTTDTFKVGVQLLDGEMKFRLNNDWTVNYGDTGADGTLEEGGDNIITTAGYYLVTFDLNNSTYTIEPAQLFGVVGSGYNDWGNAGPDFTFTEVNPGIWIAENVTIVDGEIKFRVNNDWGTNYGDTGADGTLEEGGDNIAVTAGNYTITLDFTDPSAPTYSFVVR